MSFKSDEWYDALVLYAQYAKAVGGTAYDGTDLKPLAELGERQQYGWVTAARLFREYVSKDFED